MKKSNNDFFWVTYTDLFTALFFVMLVLYILTVAILNSNLRATQEVVKKIEEIRESTSRLDDKYFKFDSSYRRFSLIREVNFPTQSAIIPSDQVPYCVQIGGAISRLVDTLKLKFANDEIKYLLVIEGMASKDPYERNYELSYERSLSLYRLWGRAGIHLDPKVCEVMIAGSGTEGVGRYGGEEETKNQRFLIQIIPKIGKLDDLIE